MSKSMTRLLAAALVAVAVPSFATIAAAAPVNGAFAIKKATPGTVETVRWRGGGWGGGWGRGWGWGGFAAGAVVGGLLAAPYYYGGYSPYYYSGYAPYYGGGYAPYYGSGYGGGGYVDRGGYYDDDGYAGGYGGGYGGGYRGGYAGRYAGRYAGGYAGGGVEYCMQRYRTYNPRTGTFIGNDGRPHPCP
jgi:hypothetical protein